VAHPICKALWWVLVSSLVIYPVVAHQADLPATPDFPISLLTWIFVALSVVLGIWTVIHRRRALADPIQARKLDPTTPAGFQAAFQPYVVNLVISESVGIFGLVLFVLSGEPLYSVLFSAAAIVLLCFHRPTAADLQPPMSAERP
jgi:hypothetical protein